MVKHPVQPVDLEQLLGDAHAAPKPPPMSIAYYDFLKTNGLDSRTFTEGPTMTRQEFAEECDINVLMQRYQNHDIGAIMRAAGEPVYYDLTTVPDDLMGYMKLMGDAENAFMTLPAQVRREFDNDPVKFVDYAGDPGNLDQMRTWGLAPPAPVEPAPVPPPSSPAPEPTKA